MTARHFHVTVSLPGYLPEATPACTDDVTDAVTILRDEIDRTVDSVEPIGVSNVSQWATDVISAVPADDAIAASLATTDVYVIVAAGYEHTVSAVHGDPYVTCPLSDHYAEALTDRDIAIGREIDHAAECRIA